NRLFRNVSAGENKGLAGRRFEDVTGRAGVGGPGGWPANLAGEFATHQPPLSWSTSTSFLDYDGDGKLDLFVCSYLTWSPGIDLKQLFTLNGRDRAYGPPVAFEGAQNLLYRNRGDGTFEDVSAKAGVQVFQRVGSDSEKGIHNVAKSMGCIVADVDQDGWPDIIVANDTVRNFFFHNVAGPDGSRRYEEIGTESGIAYAEGNARGAMGIDFAPNIRPGMHALIIGNFADEPNTYLCHEDGAGLLFTDRALAEGIAGPSRRLLKFGALFFDFDLDGRQDLLTCNGHLEPEIKTLQTGQQYAQPPQLFWNTGKSPRGFEPVPEKVAGPDLFKPLVGRGCAYADLDGDGDLDIILIGNGGPARVLRNEGGTGNHWLRLKLVGNGKTSNTSAIGARITLEAGGITQTREIASARGYLSASELTATFGLGKIAKIDKITIRWPGKQAGSPQVLTDLAIDKEHTIQQP
ncbi:MAG: CRTAC1 family protein, partial [Gemmataceae bacterium]